MGEIKEYEYEKLLVGIMYTQENTYEKILPMLKYQFGEIDSKLDSYSFSEYSKYYDSEMNGSVMRKFISFKKCVDPSSLAQIKMFTNNVEKRFSNETGREANIDPGLLSHGRFIMATTKGASFRVPLQDGIFADLSLIYARDQWVSFFWTYHDIKSKHFTAYLSQVRQIYLMQRKDMFIAESG